MSKKDKNAESQQEGILINIPGVSAETKLGELTVEQFVQLLMQVRAQRVSRKTRLSDLTVDQFAKILMQLRTQTAPPKPRSDPRFTQAVIEQISQIIDQGEGEKAVEDIQEVVQKVQEVILENMRK